MPKLLTLCLFLGALQKLQKGTISFFVSACPSIPLSVWNNLRPTGWNFTKFNICKTCREISNCFTIWQE